MLNTNINNNHHYQQSSNASSFNIAHPFRLHPTPRLPRSRYASANPSDTLLTKPIQIHHHPKIINQQQQQPAIYQFIFPPATMGSGFVATSTNNTFVENDAQKSSMTTTDLVKDVKRKKQFSNTSDSATAELLEKAMDILKPNGRDHHRAPMLQDQGMKTTSTSTLINEDTENDGSSREVYEQIGDTGLENDAALYQYRSDPTSNLVSPMLSPRMMLSSLPVMPSSPSGTGLSSYHDSPAMAAMPPRPVSQSQSPAPKPVSSPSVAFEKEESSTFYQKFKSIFPEFVSSAIVGGTKTTTTTTTTTRTTTLTAASESANGKKQNRKSKGESSLAVSNANASHSSPSSPSLSTPISPDTLTPTDKNRLMMKTSLDAQLELLVPNDLDDRKLSKIQSHAFSMTNISKVFSETLAERRRLGMDLQLLDSNRTVILSQIGKIDELIRALAAKKQQLQHHLHDMSEREGDLGMTIQTLDDKIASISAESASFERRIRTIRYDGMLESCASSASPSVSSTSTSFCSSSSSSTASSFSSSNHIRTFRGHEDSIECLDFDTPFGYLATGSADKTFGIWDMGTGQCYGRVQGHMGWIRCLQMSNHFLLTGSGDQTLRLWNLANLPMNSAGSPVPFYSTNDPITQNLCKQVFRGHTGGISCLQFSEIDNVVISGSLDKSMRVWSLETGVEMMCLRNVVESFGESAGVGVDNGRFSVGGDEQKTMRRKRRKNERPSVSKPVLEKKSFKWTMNGDGQEGSDEILETPYESVDEENNDECDYSGSEIDSEFDNEETERNVIDYSQFAPDVSSIWEADLPPQRRATNYSSESYSSQRYGAKGTHGYHHVDDELTSILTDIKKDLMSKRVTTYDDIQQQMHVKTPTQPLSTPTPTPTPTPALTSNYVGGHVASLQFYRHALASGYGDGIVRLWDLRSGDISRELCGHEGSITCLQFNDNQLVTGSLDKTVKIWDLRMGKVMEELSFDNGVTDVRFDPFKIAIAAGSSNVKIYDRVMGCMRTLEGENKGNAKPVRCLRYAGDVLVSGGMDGVAEMWRM